MIAQWVKIDIAEDNRTLIYQIFQHLMDTNVGLNDQAVRITAGKRFKEVADEWHFTPAPFAPYAARIMSQLVSLIEEVNMIENKMALLHTLSIVVERLESEVSKQSTLCKYRLTVSRSYHLLIKSSPFCLHSGKAQARSI